MRTLRRAARHAARSTRRVRSMLLPLTLSLAAATNATSAVAASEGDAADTHPLYAKGISTYKQFCSHCHGMNMVNPGTSSYDLRRWPLERQADFYDVLENGKGSMPAWGDILLPDEMDALWVYVGSRAGKEGLPPLGDSLTDTPSPAPADEPETDTPADEASLDTSGVLGEPGTLRVCLARNGRAMSGKRQDSGSGFDYAVSAWLADELDLTLAVTWFEAELEEETDPVRDNYALLAHGLCDIVPGHPSYIGAIGEPPGPRAALPRWDDRPEHFGPERQVDLEPVAIGAPYLRVESAIVFHADATRDGRPLAAGDFDAGLDALTGLDIGIEQGTLAGFLTRRQAPRDVIARSTTHNPGPLFLWQMEQRDFDAALVDVPAFDHHLRQNRVSRLQLSDWRHPFGMNIGVAALARDAALLDAIDATLDGAGSVLEALADEQGVHWSAPRTPLIQQRFDMDELAAAGKTDG